MRPHPTIPLTLLALLVGCSSVDPPAAGTAPAGMTRAPGQPAGSVQPAGPGQPAGPPLGPPAGLPPGASGGALQDPSGFPAFHDLPAPAGPAPGGVGGFGAPLALAQRPAGGYRPQVAAGADGLLRAVYYDRVDAGDIIRFRTSRDGAQWTAPETLSFEEGRNWGPDLVVRADGASVVVFDKAEKDFRSRGWLRVRGTDGRWSEPEALTPDGAREMGSGHVASPTQDQLAYVYIGKELDPNARFVATGRWWTGGAWSEPVAFTDGRQDAWHTNVEARPDGSVLAAYDVGPGGSETTLFLVDGRDGKWSAPENLSATSHPGERANFAFLGGTDWVTWFHRSGGVPRHVYVRQGRPGAWGAPAEPSKGLGGFHFDPDIAVAPDGTVCLVWGWDAGTDAELLYSLYRGQGWEPPRKVADLDWGKPGLPSIDVDSAGTFHVVWNQGVRGSNEVYYAALRADRR